MNPKRKPRTKPEPQNEAPAEQDAGQPVELQPGDVVTMPGALVEFSPTEQALAELRGRLAGVVFPVNTREGMSAAKEARRELVTLRTTLEAKRKEVKAPVLERAELIDGEAKRIRTAIEEMEDPIDSQIKAEEQRKEREREESVRAERLEASRIQGILDGLRNFPVGLAGKSADTLLDAIVELGARDLIDVPEAIRSEAIQIRDAALDRVRVMHVERKGFEAEQAEMREAKRDREFRDRIAETKALPSDLYEADAATISGAVDRLESKMLAAELGWPAHLVEEARQVRDVAIQRLNALLADRDRKERELTEAAQRAREQQEREARIAYGRDLIREVNAEPSKVIAEGLTAEQIAIRIRHLESIESAAIDVLLADEYQNVFTVALKAMRSTFIAVKGREDDARRAAQEARERAERDLRREIEQTSLLQAANAALVELRRFPSAEALVVLKLESAIERAEKTAKKAGAKKRSARK